MFLSSERFELRDRFWSRPKLCAASTQDGPRGLAQAKGNDMHLRIEPRFTTETSAVLQRLRRDTPQLPARIVDVSGVGFRLFVQEALTVGEPLRILFGDYKLLVMVRYSVPVEKGHSVGVERIDAWLQDDKAVPSAKQDAGPTLGLPQLKGHLGLLRTTALRDLFAKQTLAKNRKRLLFGGFATALGLFGLAILLRTPW
jgi:hypothetical protein